jgi:hypothetical protein
MVMDIDADVRRRLYRLLVIRPVMAWQEWRCIRARAYLLTHDISYRSSYTGMEIVRRREELYSKGVSPTDARIPDRWTIESELPKMKWPNKDHFR